MQPSRLGNYEVRGTLVVGTAGRSLLDGWDTASKRRVAIKIVPLADDYDTEEAVAELRHEARFAGRLDHPNLVALYDAGETEQVAYLVTECVDGERLDVLLD